MKENKLIKSATDRQLPDFEAIRQKCVEQDTTEKKSKIINLRPSRLAAVAAISVLAVAGMIAVVANPNAIFPKSDSDRITSSTVETSKPKISSSVNSQYHSSQTDSAASKVEKESISAKEKRYISYLNEFGYDVKNLYYLGKIGDYRICYCPDSTGESFNYEYILGNYTFTSFHRTIPYSLGLYAVNEDFCCTLGEAYEYGLFENFGDVIELIRNYGGEGELNFFADENDTVEDAFISYFGDSHPLEFSLLGDGSGYQLYYDLSQNYTDGGYDVVLGDITFTVQNAHNTYDIGLFIYYEGQIYTLTDAVNEGIVNDLTEIKSIIESEDNTEVPYSWTVRLNETDTTENPETQSADE